MEWEDGWGGCSGWERAAVDSDGRVDTGGEIEAADPTLPLLPSASSCSFGLGLGSRIPEAAAPAAMV